MRTFKKNYYNILDILYYKKINTKIIKTFINLTALKYSIVDNLSKDKITT